MFGRATAIVVVLATSGCSFAFVDRPPTAVRKTDTMPQCTVEKTWPLVDVVAAVFAVGGGIGIATGVIKDKDESTGTMRELSGSEKAYFSSLAIVEGVLFAVSAYHGNNVTNACREQRAKMPQPQPYPYPYPQPNPYPQPQPQPGPGPQPSSGGTP